jgi:hypothetical protein
MEAKEDRLFSGPVVYNVLSVHFNHIIPFTSFASPLHAMPSSIFSVMQSMAGNTAGILFRSDYRHGSRVISSVYPALSYLL